MDNFGYSNDLEQPTDFSTNVNIELKPSPEPRNVHSFEEAIDLVETGKFHYLLFLVCGTCQMIVTVEYTTINVIMPFLKCDLNPTISEQSMLTSALFIGNIIGFYPIGFFTDTWGRMKVLRIVLACAFVTTVISAFSVNNWMLIVLRFLNGIWISGCQTSVYSFLGEFHGSKTLRKYVTLLSMFLTSGFTFVPGVAAGVLPLQIDATVLGMKFAPWRVLILTCSSISLLALCGFLMLPESPRFVLIQGKHEAAMKTFRRIFRLNTGRPESEYPVEQVSIETLGANLNDIHGVKDACKMIWFQTVPLFYRERALHTINIFCMFFFVFATFDGVYTWLPTIVKQLVATSDKGYAICESIYVLGEVLTNATALADSCARPADVEMFEILIACGAIFTILNITLAFSMKKIGQRNLLMCLYVVSAVCFLAIHWVNSYIPSVVLITVALFIGMSGSILHTISVEFFPTNINAMAMSLSMLIARLGVLAGQNVVGFLIINYCDTLFYICVGIGGLLVILAIFLPDLKQQVHGHS